MEDNNHYFFSIADIVILSSVTLCPLSYNKSMDLSGDISLLPHTSPVTVKKMKSCGINSYWDLLNYFPFRYLNYSLCSNIAALQPGETVTVKGKIISAKNEYTRSRLTIQKIEVADNSGIIKAVWFNQPYLMRNFQKDHLVSVAGEVKQSGSGLSIEAQSYDLLGDDNQETIHTGRLVPVYSEQNGLSSRLLREKIFYLLNNFRNLDEFLPPEIVLYNKLLPPYTAYRQFHFPDNKLSADQARNRLAFDELFVIQLSSLLTRNLWQREKVSRVFFINEKITNKINEFIGRLSFKLTAAQNRVKEEIFSDLIKTKPMNRFLQGEVGSGKTIIAAIAGYFSFLNGYKTLLMAPTEILANQHLRTLREVFENSGVKIGIQTHSKKSIRIDKKTSDDSVKNIINTDNPDILVGTQALLNKKLNLDNVGLVIIDEQHRFGVSQRSLLKEKGINPHLLTMTATPIPRTVALTLYGELDMSVIDEMPIGRLPIKTYMVEKNKRYDAYRWIRKQIRDNESQAFIVCPLIEESETETMKSVKAAKKEVEYLQKEIFPDLKIGLVHGKIKAGEKDQAMKDFKNKKFDILVATPVVEVGIDIANATLMLIEGAERFGLAQLHQLRGRIGRGNKQSYCLLFTESDNKDVLNRLKLFSSTLNGLKLAEYDLKVRGPGEIFGTRQHGYLDLKVASLADNELIQQSRNAAEYFLKHHRNPAQWPDIEKKLTELQKKQISRD